jgi:hypothetical protein
MGQGLVLLASPSDGAPRNDAGRQRDINHGVRGWWKPAGLHTKTVTQRRDRQPEQLPEFDDFLDGAFGQPGTDPAPDEVAVFPSADLKTQLGNLGQLGAVDHRREIEPLLAGDHGDPDVAVLGRLDRRYFDRAQDRRRLQQLGVQPFATLHQRDRFQHGQIQVLAGSATLDAAAQRQRAECGRHPAHVLAEVTTDRDRWSGRIAAETG